MTAGSNNTVQIATPYESPQTQGIGGLNLSGLWALYVLTLRQHMHGKRWMIMALLFLLPAAFAFVLRNSARDVPLVAIEFMMAFLFLPQAILPLVALIYASGIIQDEQENQTLTYLLIRPIPKWALYTAKLLATLTTTVVLTAAFTALVYAVIYIGAPDTGEDVVLRALKAMGVHSLAIVVYCCLFGVLSLLTKRFLVTGILYIIFIEGALGNLPIGLRFLTVIYYTRLVAYRMMPFKAPHFGRTEDIAATIWRLDVQNNPMLAGYPSTDTCLLVLLGASLAFTIAAAVICSRTEFHVKTPGKE